MKRLDSLEASYRCCAWGLWICVLMMIALWLTSCTTTKVVTVEKVKTDTTYITKQQRDSIKAMTQERLSRTNLNFMNVDKDSKAKVIQTLSTLPHAGKTFISTNLAMTLAISGKKVLLMDLDLRRRTLSKQMGHRNDRRGLTSYLSGTLSSLNDAISKTSLHDNLDM